MTCSDCNGMNDTTPAEPLDRDDLLLRYAELVVDHAARRRATS